nr:MAG TPA: hypothetical protein [Caudoviricetes sp.]
MWTFTTHYGNSRYTFSYWILRASHGITFDHFWL